MLEQLTKEAEFNLVRDVWIEPGSDTSALTSPNIHWLTLIGPLGGVSYSYMDNRYPLSVDPNDIPDTLKMVLVFLLDIIHTLQFMKGSWNMNVVSFQIKKATAIILRLHL